MEAYSLQEVPKRIKFYESKPTCQCRGQSNPFRPLEISPADIPYRCFNHIKGEPLGTRRRIIGQSTGRGLQQRATSPSRGQEDVRVIEKKTLSLARGGVGGRDGHSSVGDWKKSPEGLPIRAITM